MALTANFKMSLIGDMINFKVPSDAPLAQSVEHAAVNRSVVGSSPTRGANLSFELVSRRMSAIA